MTRVLNDEKLVPLRWVFASLALGISSLGVAIGSAIAVGSWTTGVSLGQTTLDKRITNIESDRAVRIRDGENFQKESLQRLAAIETKLDLALRKR